MESSNDDCKRTLIISANSFSTLSNNGKMLSSFFQGYPSDKLAQLYIWPEYPDNDICLRYFRITDLDMVRGIFNHRDCGGTVSLLQNQRDQTATFVYGASVTQWPSARLAREIVWLHHGWRSPLFLSWLDDFKPQIVFFSGVNSLALYRIANFIAKRFRIPVIVYITDDFFLPRFSLSAAFHIRRFWLNCAMKSILKNNISRLLVVNEYMRGAYKKQFNKDSLVILNCASIPIQCPPFKKSQKPINVTFIGNLFNNRSSTMLKLRKIIEKYPHRECFRFDIYTREVLSDRILKGITFPPIMQHCGALDALGVKDKLSSSDVLMHIESFHYKNRKDTLLSLSTKITEYMAAAKPIFIVAPPEVGTMRFLSENTSNICVQNLQPQTVYAALDSLLDEEVRREVGIRNYHIIKSMIKENNMDDLIRRISLEISSDCVQS